MHILVADDSSVIRYILKKKLLLWGYKVLEAEDGTQAWELINSSYKPRIVLIDWMMPGMNGLEVCEKIKNSRMKHFIYTILLTSRNDEADMIAALESGAHTFLNKPVTYPILKSQIAVGVRMIEAEDSLIEAEKKEAVTTLIKGVAHHFSNLNVRILGYAELMLLDNNINEKQKEWLTIIIDNIKKATEITQSLHYFSEDGIPEKKQHNLNELLQETIASLIENSGFQEFRIVTQLDESLPSVWVNRPQILLVIMNILTNAIHAVQGRAKRRISVTSGFTEEIVYLRFEDSGCGIPAQNRGEIFSPFFSTKGVKAVRDSFQKNIKGFGLGLTVAQKIMRDHDGTIDVESVENEGSIFTLWFPV